jgi:hypothetical protein
MRLTLRTLLAYRDGMLEAKDAATLEQKLRESTTARQISQRIDQSIHNPKLAPIPLDAKDFGFDLNQMAEYLDDTIPTDQIPDFERRCLENNALLSEVGSCHQILTHALTQSVEISDDLRERIHRLPTSPDARPSKLRFQRLASNGNTLRIDNPTAPPISKDQAKSSTKTENIAKPSMRQSSPEPRGAGIELDEGLGHQVPEYLIGSDYHWLKNGLMAAALLSALLLVGAVAIGPWDQLKKMLASTAPGVGAETQANRANTVTRRPKPTRLDPVEESTSESPAMEDQQPTVRPSEALSEVETSKRDGSKKDSDQSSSEPKRSSELDNPPSAENSPTTPAENSSDKKTTESEPAPTVPLSVGASLAWLPETSESNQAIVFRSTNNAEPRRVERLQSGEKVAVAESMIIPPFQRTEIQIEPGIRSVIAGETEISPATSDTSTKCILHFGRMIAFPTPQAKQLEIETRDLVLSIEFLGSDSCVAIDLSASWQPASSEDLVSRKISVVPRLQIISVQGSSSIRIVDRLKGSELFQGPVELGNTVSSYGTTLAGPAELTELPAWLRANADRTIDQIASKDFAKNLASANGPEMLEVLRSLANHQRSETAVLAVRTLGMLGEYDKLFGENGVLNRKNMSNHLAGWYSSLPHYLNSKEDLSRFIGDLNEGMGSRAETILRLLVPLSAEQLASDGDKLLIETLSAGNLDERLLSFLQLNFITGKKLGYNPDRSTSDSLQQWRRMLAKKEIQYPSP